MSSTIAVAFVTVVLVVGGLIAYAIFQLGQRNPHTERLAQKATRPDA